MKKTSSHSFRKSFAATTAFLMVKSVYHLFFAIVPTRSMHAKAVLLIRRLTGKLMKILSYAAETIREKMFRLTGRDILCCPHCLQGTMVYGATLHPANSN